MTVATLPLTDAPAPAPTSSRMKIAGHILSGLIVAMFTLDGAMKLAAPEMMIRYSPPGIWPADPMQYRLLGVLLLGSTLLYAIPRTAVLGAVLLTGYLGGAVATHVRMYDPLFSHTLFGVYLGVIAWGGLWLRDSRVRALLPLR